MFMPRAIDVNDGNCTAIAEAAILRRAARLGLLDRPGGWSAAELRLSVQDYEWLRAWADSPWALNRWAEGWGLCVLVYLAEYCRRNASEGELWQALSAGEDKPALHELLVPVGSQPDYNVMRPVRQAIMEHGLRHGLGGGKRWLNTVFLQFGVSWPGLYDRLPVWLSGQLPPVAVRMLLGDELMTVGSPSKSFDELWLTLSGLHAGVIRLEDAQPVLEASPWVLEEWVDYLLELAVTHISHSYGMRTYHARAPKPVSASFEQALRRNRESRKRYKGGSPVLVQSGFKSAVALALDAVRGKAARSRMVALLISVAVLVALLWGAQPAQPT